MQLVAAAEPGQWGSSMPKIRAYHRVQEDAVPQSKKIWWCANRPDCDGVLGVVRNDTIEVIVGAVERVSWDTEGGFTVQCRWCRHWTSQHVLRGAG